MVFTGNISPAQFFDTVVKAAKLLAEKGYEKIRWIIVGDGMTRKWLENEVASHGISDRFVFIGHVPVEEVPKYLHIARLSICLSFKKRIAGLCLAR